MSSAEPRSPHLFWVHCNRCAAGLFSPVSPQSGPTRMVITSCGCIFCLSCSGPATEAGCVSCGARTVKTMPLGKSLPPQVMEMFNSNVNSLGKLPKRSMFQKRQMDKITKLMMNLESEKKAKMKKEVDVIRDLDKEMERLQRQLREAEAEIERLSHKGPGRRSLAQPGASPSVGGRAWCGGDQKGDFTVNRLF